MIPRNLLKGEKRALQGKEVTSLSTKQAEGKEEKYIIKVYR